MNNINDNLIQVIDFWKKTAISDHLFLRMAESELRMEDDEIVAVIGPRRSGKSSFLKLIIQKLPPESWLYINFEDPFFIENKEAVIVDQIVETYLNNFSPKLKYLFFDEIQNIDKWEKAVRKFHESKKYKIFVTGSSSKLLSQEFSTVLTGRHKTIKILPLNFKEFLSFRNLKIEKKADFVIKDQEIQNLFKEYLFFGGFPRVVLDKKPEVLKQYFSDIVQKDIVGRYEIRQREKLERLGIYLLSNVANVYSISALSRTFDISWEYVQLYIQYFKEAFILSELKQFSYSLKTQEKAYNKIYAIDNGLVAAVSFKFSENIGAALENCAYNYFSNNFDEVYYYKTESNAEVDFVIKQDKRVAALIQVCADMSDSDTSKRELKGLIEAAKELKCKKLIVATLDYQEKIQVGNYEIICMPLYKIILGLLKIE